MSSTDSFGQLWKIRSYTNNKENGEGKSYYENGQLWRIYNFTNGEINGEYKEYSENGELIEDIII
jgi:antitoxin component YwqK of YwqJK toxin-antitoxin module